MVSPIKDLHDPSIYDGIESLGLTTDLQGWHSDHPIFSKLIAEVKPTTIVEVGSWKGASAVHMASRSSARIFCVDTWMGGIDHALSILPQDQFPKERGYPRLYFQFLHNVKASGYADRITPVPQTSINGARILLAHEVKAQLIYIDGSHEYPDAFLDMAAYWKLLEPGGIMFGDDCGFPGVWASFWRFVAENHLFQQKEIVADNFWIVRKAS